MDPDASETPRVAADILKTAAESRRLGGANGGRAGGGHAAGIAALAIAQAASAVVLKTKADELLNRLIAHVRLTNPAAGEPGSNTSTGSIKSKLPLALEDGARTKSPSTEHAHGMCSPRIRGMQ